jgi:hypothetical protein
VGSAVDVDRNRNVEVRAHPPPEVDLGADLVQHPARDALRQPADLRHADEPVRGQYSVRRMVPADERLEANDATAGHLELGLVLA